MNIKYLKYLFDKTKLIYLLIFAVYILTFPFLILFLDEQSRSFIKSLINFPTIIFITLGYVSALIEHRSFFSKEGIRLFLSLPDRRIVLYRTTFFYTMIMNILMYNITMLLGIGSLAAVNLNYNVEYIFLHMLLETIVFIIVYTFTSFITIRTSRFIDAIIVNLLYLALPAAVIFVTRDTLTQVTLDWYSISTIGMADKISIYCSERLVSNNFVPMKNPYLFIFLPLLSIVFYLGTVMRLKFIKPEAINSNQYSLFTYPLLIVLYVYLFMMLLNYTSLGIFILAFSMIIILYSIVSVLKRQKIRFNYIRLIQFIVITILANLTVFFFK